MKGSLPKISIVTPSFNQAAYIERTILSVLDQGYPNLEYIVIDAGSTDGTIEILQAYRSRLARLIIEPDRGSADAINKGLSLVTGEWFNWLNSDDYLLPGALHLLAEHISRNPDVNWISGCKLNIDQAGRCVSSQAPWREDLNFLLLGAPLFPQDATFLRLHFLKQNNISLDPGLQNVYDTVLYLQLLRHEQPLLVSSVISAMRWHPAQKTANQEQRALESRHVEAEFRRLKGWAWLRFSRRIASTRFSRAILFVLFVLAFLRLWPSRLDWRVEAYDHWRRIYVCKRVRDFYLA